MVWYDKDSWVTAAFAPKPATIALTFILAILLPILLHQFLYRKSAPATLPTVLLVGPSGGGKTAFLTLVRLFSYVWGWGRGRKLKDGPFPAGPRSVNFHMYVRLTSAARLNATWSLKHTRPLLPSPSRPSSLKATRPARHTSVPLATLRLSARAAFSLLTLLAMESSATLRRSSWSTPPISAGLSLC
jgi:hypothetical protein